MFKPARRSGLKTLCGQQYVSKLSIHKGQRRSCVGHDESGKAITGLKYIYQSQKHMFTLQYEMRKLGLLT